MRQDRSEEAVWDSQSEVKCTAGRDTGRLIPVSRPFCVEKNDDLRGKMMISRKCSGRKREAPCRENVYSRERGNFN